MKTLTRYVVAAAVVVTFLVALKVLIMVPPENDKDPYSERHNEDKGVLLWGRSNEDGHDELSSFGNNNPRLTGEMGRGVILPPGEKTRGEEALKKYNVNVLASDLISLNRKIPDSRPAGCKSVQYPDNLPGTTIVIPFHNEWPSVLLRTVYSIINRTPKQLLEQIILVDDASDLPSLKKDLDHFISEHFPANLVKIVRLPERVGLIRARLEGFSHVTAEVVSFFDSHMEVNTDWLQPLLVEIVRDRRTVAMGHLDYILPDTFEYSFTPGYRTRYGFDWRLIFFETYFLKSQEKGKDVTDPIPGVVMVGPGFAVNADYFREMGTYDEGMKIWGGENLELAWRIWMCGGRLVHMACSKLGHIARPQPYSFPEGRYETEIHNYKRAIEVWMGPYKKLVYEHHPKMKELDAGDLTERLALKNRLQCNDFTWFLKNVWPELYPYGDNATHWGGVKNQKEELCLDNNQYLFLGPEKLAVKDCDYEPETQSFSLTIDHKLRSVLQCVGVQEEGADMVPVLITCHDEPFHTWTYTMKEGEHITWTYTEQFQLKHDQTGLCLQMMANQHLVMHSCKRGEASQIWRFENTGPPTSLANEGQVGSQQQQQQQQQQKQKAEQKPQATKSSRDVDLLDAFQKQLFLEKENWERGANMAGMPAGNLMQGDAAMMHGGVPMMQGGGQMMHGGGQMVQGGAPYLMQGGAPRMMQGGGAPDMMQGGRKAGGAGVQNMQMRGGGAMPGMMQPGPAANMQMMHGGGGVPAMQRGGGMPALQGAGGMPIMQGAGGMPVMQGGGGMPAMQRGGGMPAMQGAGGMPVMQGAGGMPAMPRGGAMAGGGAHRMQGGGAVPMMQGGGAMPIAGGAGMSRNGGHMQGGGAPVRGGAGNAYNAQPQMKMAGAQNMNAVPLNKRSVGGPKAKHFAGGAQQAMDQVDMQEMMNRQLYAEAKRAGRAR